MQDEFRIKSNGAVNTATENIQRIFRFKYFKKYSPLKAEIVIIVTM